jgi:hypothetical protein
VALSGDGDTLAVGTWEGVEVYLHDDDQGWHLQDSFLGSNTGYLDCFGWSVSLSDDGDTLAVGEVHTQVALQGTGAAYVLRRDEQGWSEETYLVSSNADELDAFGWSVDLSGDGKTLAVSALREDSHALGLDGDQDDDSALDAGAVYVFVENDETWSQQAYVKAANTRGGDGFGVDVALSSDGGILVVGAPWENDYATGVGQEPSGVAFDSGAVYVY